jgi:hypothetical protein
MQVPEGESPQRQEQQHLPCLKNRMDTRQGGLGRRKRRRMGRGQKGCGEQIIKKARVVGVWFCFAFEYFTFKIIVYLSCNLPF